ncbi:MAG: hypothetical protein HC824_06035, partial [Synechococcales cyanobacterium RM1_1_8]|nr:hypothetical protein [Synechococcales cyanobacterium RM1_1_8]
MLRTLAQQQLTAQTRCRLQLRRALRSLGVSPTRSRLEAWSNLIGSSLGSGARLFHNMEHVLQLCDGCEATASIAPVDGIRILAALFHDLVYVQIDGGLPRATCGLLNPFLLWRDGELYVRGLSCLQRHRSSALVAQIFGFDHCEAQPARLHNELLSALVMVRCLEGWLGWGDLAQAIAAIEATIPFRSQPQGFPHQNPAEQLFLRLHQANSGFDLALGNRTILEAVHRAVAFANCDVESFTRRDPAVFLAYTWRLLPEFNPALRDPQGYGVQDYRRALQQMELFVQRLDANCIFQQFRHSPEPHICQAWQRRAAHNLNVAKLYLRVKLVAIALLEALAPYYSGGGAMADWICSPPGQPAWQEGFGCRNLLSQPLTTPAQQQVLAVAEQGRIGDCSFDLSQSPLAAFLMRSLGFERIDQLYRQAEAVNAPS